MRTRSKIIGLLTAVLAGLAMLGPGVATASAATDSSIGGVISAPEGRTLAGTDLWVEVEDPAVVGYEAKQAAVAADGSWRIGLPPGTYSVTVRDHWKSYPTQGIADSVTVGAEAATLDYVLRGSVITGRVTAPAASSPSLTLYPVLDDGTLGWDAVRLGVGSDGTYDVGVFPGDYKIMIGDDAYPPVIPDQWYRAGGAAIDSADADIVTVSGDRRELDIAVAGAARISGKVLAPVGQSVDLADCNVTAHAGARDGSSTGRQSRSDFASDGSFGLDVLPGMKYRLEAHCMDWTGGSGEPPPIPDQWYRAGGNVGSEAQATDVPAGTENLQVPLSVGVVVSGRVTPPPGRSLGRHNEIEFVRDGQVAASREADAGDGTYSVRVLPGGYKIHLDFPAAAGRSDFDGIPDQWYHSLGNVALEADAEVVDLAGEQVVRDIQALDDVPGVGSIRGKLVPAAGESLSSWTSLPLVEVVDLDGHRVDYVWPDKGTGGFVFPNIPSGSYRLRLSHTGGALQWYRPQGNVVSPAGATVVEVANSDVDVNVPISRATAAVSGRVRGPGGSPVGAPRLRIAVFDESGGRAQFLLSDAVLGDQWVGADGTYALNIPAGRYRLKFYSNHGGGYPIQWYNAAGNVRDAAGAGWLEASQSQTLDIELLGWGAATAPAAPRKPVAQAGNGQVALTWVAPGSNGGAQVTDYRIEVSGDGGATWAVHADGVSTAPRATLTGLTNGTGYMFRVAAINSVGVGATSPASDRVTPAAPPPPPPPPSVVVPPQDQHVGGRVPTSVKKKGKPSVLPTRTDAGQAIAWSSSTPKICKVKRGKLVTTGKKGVCRLTAVGGSTSTHRDLRQSYAIRVR